MRKILPLSCITMALMLAGCGGSSNSISVENIDAQVVEDKTYEHTFADLDNKTPVVTGLASNGNVQITTSGFNYVPNANFNGADSATIEVGKTRYTVQFTVTAENDLPTIATTDMEVGASSEIQGQISVADVDDEDVKVALKKAPEVGDLTLNADGSFVYKNDDLTLPSLSFEVTLDDGHGETVDFTINLSAAYDSNEDKANYYYASNKSHLKQAESRIAAINDDALVVEAYTAIAQGYALASLDDQVAIIFDNKITLQRQKADLAYGLASTYHRLGKAELASQYLDKALQSLLTYLADIGVENMASADRKLVINLYRNFRDFGQGASLDTALNSLNFIISQARTEEYSGSYSGLVLEQRNVIRTLADQYLLLADDDLTKQPFAEQIAKELKLYVEQVKGIAPRFTTINDVPDQAFHSIAAVRLGDAIPLAIAINNFDLAKDFLAQTIAYYGDANYDSEYQYPADQHAANTLARHRYALADAVTYFDLLYPNAAENAALQLHDFELSTDRRLKNDIVNEKLITDAVASISSGNSVTQALEPITQASPDNPYIQQDLLTKRSLVTPSVSSFLFGLSNDEKALDVVTASLNLTLSEELVVEKTGNHLHTLGTSGCYKIASIYLKKGLLDLQKAAAQRCHDEMYVKYYAPYFANNDSPYRPLDHDKAVFAQADLFFAARDNAKVAKLLTDTEQFIARRDFDEQVDLYAEYGNRAMAAGQFELALKYFEQGKTLILEDESLTGTTAIRTFSDFNELINLYDEYNSKSLTYSAENELRRRGYNDEKYADYLKQLRDIATAVNDKMATILKAESDSNRLRYGDDVVELLASNRQYSAAQQLVSDLELGEADSNELLVLISMIQALQEDFPGSLVASIDSDNDGKANFFAITATDEDKENTDIELDNDADGDGIADEDDPTPLG
ncbi:cadherin-like domain-containing protein [Psychrobium sp. MM17-31]|uniref:Ig-like domain-containing protein n=1 Tax=Psychrobium sp. MM17-31 TaxID=2917758 RepID=UPI001EF64565|nr:Ig-like domain-containing protein [Psychrobium sp. MM17-31]MCG7532531.1 cadherin-like domain-containing protein [Psychrobium sp. MM17-31]